MPSPPNRHRWLWVSAVILVIGVCFVPGAMSLWGRPEPRPVAGPGMLRVDGRLPNVLILTVDTLRADHVYGVAPSSWRLTPALERLAAGGTLFAETMTGAPATRPGLAGLMTGSYPHRHGIFSNFGTTAAGVPLLADVLQSNGYVTAAFYGNDVLKPKSGFGRGFSTYQTFVDNRRFSNDPDGIDRALVWIESAPQQPWLLWVHLMSPHGPYNSSPRSEIAAAAPDPLPDVELRPSTSNYGLGPMIPLYQIMQIPPRAAAYRRRYRDEVVFVDGQIARLLAGIAKPELASTLVVFTADHGESLGENDYFFQHGWLANEPSLHVPMIWSQPGRIAAGHRVEETVSLVDVLPTVLTGLGLAVPPVDGRSLLPALAGETLPEATAFALTAYPNQVTAAVRGRWKLVHTPPPPRPLPSDYWHDFYAPVESWTLYDLRADPGETKDVSADRPRETDALRDELRTWEARNGLPSGTRGVVPADAETLERLRALGYVN